MIKHDTFRGNSWDKQAKKLPCSVSFLEETGGAAPGVPRRIGSFYAPQAHISAATNRAENGPFEACGGIAAISRSKFLLCADTPQDAGQPQCHLCAMLRHSFCNQIVSLVAADDVDSDQMDDGAEVT